MKLSTILVSFAATAMAAWIFLFTSEVRAAPALPQIVHAASTLISR